MQVNGFLNGWKEAPKYWFSHIGNGVSFKRFIREPYGNDGFVLVIFGFSWFGEFSKVPNE